MSIVVLFPEEGESWSSFARRLEAEKGDLLLILSGTEESLLHDEEERKSLLSVLAAQAGRVRVASRHKKFVAAARAKGIRVVDRAADVKKLLRNNPRSEEALRLFLPHVWQKELRSRLQSIGLLSLPKLRIWSLIAVSVTLFFFVLFWLLPSAEIKVWPREDAVSQTANIFLVQSGATTADIPPRVRTMELKPIRVKIDHSFTFDQVSKDFIGESAKVDMTIVNKSNERYSLRGGTRVMNQAGMIFILIDPINVEAGGELVVRSEAADVDIYGEIIGERGNLPAGLRWDFPGLAPSERQLVYAENRIGSKGGRTSFRTVLHDGDLEVARKRLEQELLAQAKQLVDEEKTLYTSRHADQVMEILYYDELTKTHFHNITLPTEFLGESVVSVPVSGSLEYVAFMYDKQKVLDILSEELRQHVENNKLLLEESLRMERIETFVQSWDDDLRWVKITVDLSGTEQYVLDPLTPTGARFAKQVRTLITGLSKEEALRVLKNLPEVENVQISIWPPWSRMLPRIPSHISLAPMARSVSASDD